MIKVIVCMQVEHRQVEECSPDVQTAREVLPRGGDIVLFAARSEVFWQTNGPSRHLQQPDTN
jgi:hypothetical protein